MVEPEPTGNRNDSHEFSPGIVDPNEEDTWLVAPREVLKRWNKGPRLVKRIRLNGSLGERLPLPATRLKLGSLVDDFSIHGVEASGLHADAAMRTVKTSRAGDKK
jgi:hypothetical protein